MVDTRPTGVAVSGDLVRRRFGRGSDVIALPAKRFEPFQIARPLGRGERPRDADAVDEDEMKDADHDQLHLLSSQRCWQEVDRGREEEMPAEERIGAGGWKL